MLEKEIIKETIINYAPLPIVIAGNQPTTNSGNANINVPINLIKSSNKKFQRTWEALKENKKGEKKMINEIKTEIETLLRSGTTYSALTEVINKYGGKINKTIKTKTRIKAILFTLPDDKEEYAINNTLLIKDNDTNIGDYIGLDCYRDINLDLKELEEHREAFCKSLIHSTE